MSDPYKVLGISRDATDDEIKKAYRQLSRKYHPDANVNNPDKDKAEEMFKLVQQAYQQVMYERQHPYSSGSAYGGRPQGGTSYGGSPYGQAGSGQGSPQVAGRPGRMRTARHTHTTAISRTSPISGTNSSALTASETRTPARMRARRPFIFAQRHPTSTTACSRKP